MPLPELQAFAASLGISETAGMRKSELISAIASRQDPAHPSGGEEPSPLRTRKRRGSTGLNALLIPELQALAASLGISDTERMRKGELISAIASRQNSVGSPGDTVASSDTVPLGETDSRGEAVSGPSSAKRRRGGTGLSAMLFPELQSLAASLGIGGTARMRKGQLISAIVEQQDSGQWDDVRQLIVERRYEEARAAMDELKSNGFRAEIENVLRLVETGDIARVEWITGVWVALTATRVLESRNDAPEPPAADELTEIPAVQPPAIPTSRPEVAGATLEVAFVRLLQRLFTPAARAEGRIIERLRRQNGGTQFGHDIEFDATDAVTGLVRCHVECKNYRSQDHLTLAAVAPKLLETDFHWRENLVNHLIFVSPHLDPTNDLSLMIQTWNETRRFPFTIQVWSPEHGIVDLFRLVPEVYRAIYDREPGPLSDDEQATIVQKWRDRIKPVPNLAAHWLRYLRTPSRHHVIGEDPEDFTEVWHHPVSLEALSDTGAPLPGTLMSTVRDWLDDDTRQCLLLLGDFGDGKTFFSYQLGWALAQEFLADPESGTIPLRIPLRAIRQHPGAADLLAARLTEIQSNSREWQDLSETYRTLIVLDGFDEMSARLDPDAMAKNFARLSECIAQFPHSKILITSRPHFYSHLRDYQNFVNDAGDPRVVRIAPISLEARLEHLRAHARTIGAEAKLKRLQRLYDPIGLAAKPLFLQMIKATLPALPNDHFNELILYRSYVRESLTRKIRDLRIEASPAIDDDLINNLQAILEEVALQLHESTTEYVDLREIAVGRSDDLAEMLWQMSGASSADPETTGSDARARVGTRSLLKPVRDGASQTWTVDFFHRSMREYFIARALVRAIAGESDQAVAMLSRVPLQPEIVHFATHLMRDPSDVAPNTAVETFTDVLHSLTRRATLPRYAGKTLGGNAMTLLYTLNGNLPHGDWSHLALDYVYLAGADLDGMTFRHSTLRYANLDNTSLAGADLSHCDLTGVQLEETAAVVSIALDEDNSTVFAGYTDNSIRRWRVEAGRRAICVTIADLDFRPESLSLTPQKDVFVMGGTDPHRRVTVLGAGADDQWAPLCAFTADSTIISVAVRKQRAVLERRKQRSGASKIEVFLPDGRVLESAKVIRGSGYSMLALGPDCVISQDKAQTVMWSGPVNGLSAPRRVLPLPSSICLDGRLLDQTEALLLLGHADGQLSLWSVDLDGTAEPRPLWQITAHTGAVSSVRLSGGFALSGGVDRTMNLFPLMDDWKVGPPISLHRTLRCTGLRIDGVKGAAEHDLLTDLVRRSTATETSA
ncbi:Rho termination factor N-terminal domain-containing protein [Actinoplanes sp. TRM88002]|uniref:Rho termination factor N-terminal domain-containing protein n=2 Tax=Paractinoplanes hotanensis TaxID=2906497 RepID=A0ABT0XWR7_9ACTN|nr:Rho termination factor N-terminal domain-containing protein [Actinoplanes hotanensis]